MSKSTTFKVENPVYTHIFPEPPRLLEGAIDERPPCRPRHDLVSRAEAETMIAEAVAAERESR